MRPRSWRPSNVRPDTFCVAREVDVHTESFSMSRFWSSCFLYSPSFLLFFHSAVVFLACSLPVPLARLVGLRRQAVLGSLV